jgi:NAD(P)-dependent dehydrogenase (short-subunit alcohol dehydrogenase family)
MADAPKTAIVTGACRSIGAAPVEAFLNRGNGVVANSRNIGQSKPFEASAKLALVAGDIGDPETAARVVATGVARFGRIDVLINNAGIFILKPFTEYSAQDFNDLLTTTRKRPRWTD